MAIAILLVALVGYAGLAGYLFFFQNSMVFHPRKGLDATPDQWGMAFKPAELSSENHRLGGWWIPGDADKPVVLFFHGNRSVLSDLRPHLALFHRLGLGSFLFDYRGYGLSEGQPTEAGVYADALAAWQYVTGDLQIDSARLVYFGHSLGGGVATWLAVKHPPKALILEGTFTSVPDLGAHRYPFLPIRLMSRIFFDNLNRIKTIHVPLLIIHSRDDEKIFFASALSLLSAANAPKSLLETRGAHDTSFNQGGEVSEAGLMRFLDGVFN